MKLIKILFFTIILSSCGIDERDGVNFGKGYRFDYDEVSNYYVIFGPHENTYAVSQNVMRYNFNSTFIIAEQKPREIFDKTLHGENYDEQERLFERFKLRYYWIINKTNNKKYGPLTWHDFIKKQNELKIPKSLKLIYK